MPYFSELFCGCSFPSIASRTSNPAIDSGDRIASRTDRELNAPREPSGGAVSALLYEADPNDPIDMQLWWHLANADRITAANVMLQRVKPGEYWLDGRHVTLRWGLVDGERAELVVCESGDETNGASEVALFDYLRQAGDVVASLHGRSAGVPVVVRVPQANRLTFVDTSLPKDLNDPSEERVKSMQMACEQARLREQAAELYERSEIIKNSCKTGSFLTRTLPTVSTVSTATALKTAPLVTRTAARSATPSGQRIVSQTTTTVTTRQRSVTPPAQIRRP